MKIENISESVNKSKSTKTAIIRRIGRGMYDAKDVERGYCVLTNITSTMLKGAVAILESMGYYVENKYE